MFEQKQRKDTYKIIFKALDLCENKPIQGKAWVEAWSFEDAGYQAIDSKEFHEHTILWERKVKYISQIKPIGIILESL